MCINYVVGDATNPIDAPGLNARFILHIVNDRGGWGAGFVVALSRRWPHVEQAYRRWAQGQRHPSDLGWSPFALGEVQCVSAWPKWPVPDGPSSIFVFNMVAQHGVGLAPDGTPPIRYDALEACLKKVGTYIQVPGITVHMPRIGCDRAGGQWTEVEAIIARTLTKCDVYVYDLPGQPFVQR